MSDLNKTPLTKAVTAGAYSWLCGIGAKAVETEVLVSAGWIADLAAFWNPTMTEARRTKIIPPRLTWEEDRAAMQGLPQFLTIAHEVKTSRSDFTQDKKWGKEAVADMQILSYPNGLIAASEIPNGWWGLEHAKDGSVWMVAKRSPLNQISDKKRLTLIGWLADRMHNRTANARFNEFAKAQREERRQEVINGRLDNIARTVFAVAKGDKTPEEAINWHFGYDAKKVSRYTKESLEKIFKIAVNNA